MNLNSVFGTDYTITRDDFIIGDNGIQRLAKHYMEDPMPTNVNIDNLTRRQIYEGTYEWTIENEDNLDYTPSKTLSKKIGLLIDRSANLMTSSLPLINISSNASEEYNNQVNKIVYDRLEKTSGQWNLSVKDSMVYGHTAARVFADKGKSVVKYHTFDEVYYEENDYGDVICCMIAYTTASTAGNLNADTRRIIFNTVWIEDDVVYEEGGVADGNGIIIEYTTPKHVLPYKEVNTYIILNDGGISDVDLAKEQIIELSSRLGKMTDGANHGSTPLLHIKDSSFILSSNTDGDGQVTKFIKVSPGSTLITNTIGDNGSADFIQPDLNKSYVYEKFLTDFWNREIHEIYGFPIDEDVSKLPSSSSQLTLLKDVIARLNNKWLWWKPAFDWIVRMIIFVEQNLGNIPSTVAPEDFDISIQPSYDVVEDKNLQIRVLMEMKRDLPNLPEEFIIRKAFPEQADEILSYMKENPVPVQESSIPVQKVAIQEDTE